MHGSPPSQVFLLKYGFVQSASDSFLFILLLYVDDIILTGNSQDILHAFLHDLQVTFAMKDLGSLSYFLGIEVTKTATGLHLSQAKYISDVLEKSGMGTCKPSSTPVALRSSNTQQSDTTAFENPQFFRSIVGLLQYITITRPKITYAVNTVCQSMHHPTNSDFGAVKRILRYLQGTRTHGMLLQKSEPRLYAYSDSDWVADCTDCRSVTGNVISLGLNPILWTSKKQRTVAKSSTKAEYRALAYTAMDLAWLQMILTDLGVTTSHIPQLYCDNTTAIALTSNPVFHSRTKHIAVDFHFVREKAQQKELTLRYVPSQHQLADQLTKPLPSPRFALLRDKLIVFPPISLRGADR